MGSDDVKDGEILLASAEFGAIFNFGIIDNIVLISSLGACLVLGLI